MKIIKIGNISLEVAESNEELSPSREKDVRELLLSLIQYDKTPAEVITECLKDFNNQLYSSLAQKLSNYLEFINVNNQVDIYNALFCLISFEKGEKKDTLGNLEVIEKSKKLAEAGLTFEICKTEIENFLIAYPRIKKILEVIKG